MMAHFYGWVKGGASSIAARLGTKRSGIHIHAASHQGKIYVSIRYEEGVDIFTVWQLPHEGQGVAQKLSEGIIGQRVDMEV